MDILKVILMAIALVSVAILGMAIRMLLVKGGKFPNTHVSGNKRLKKEGIYCAQTQDKLAQRDANKKLKFKKISLAPEFEAGK